MDRCLCLGEPSDSAGLAGTRAVLQPAAGQHIPAAPYSLTKPNQQTKIAHVFIMLIQNEFNTLDGILMFFMNKVTEFKLSDCF